jgi:phage terminase Nu1 subunit (DNA packaging protein)
MNLNQLQLAETFGVSDRTIRHWQTEGMPVQEQNHSGNEYRLSEVLEWYIKRRIGSELQYEKTRLFAAQAHKTELECEFLRLELIRTTEVESTWATIRNEFQQKISQIPEQIPASILKITNLVDAKQQLREIFAQALEDLAKLEPQTKAK